MHYNLMDRSSDTTALSPTPFSPFSQESTHSFESGTSEEHADLGFASVFQALSELAPLPAPRIRNNLSTPTSSLLVSPSDNDNDSDPLSNTVWDQSNVSEYLTNSSAYVTSHDRTLAVSDHDSAASDTENDGENGFHDQDRDNDEYDDFDTTQSSYSHLLHGPPYSSEVDQPSLGYLDDVLGFIAAEREKFAAQREAGIRGGSSAASTSESAWKHVIEPRRKRRRKRGKHGASTGGGTSGAVSRQERDLLHDESELIQDSQNDGLMTPVGDVIDGSSSEFDVERYNQYLISTGRSMPSTPPRILRKPKRNGQNKLNVDPTSSSSNADPIKGGTNTGSGANANADNSNGTHSSPHQHPLYKLMHSRSTPSLRLTIPIAPDSRVLRLRTLATKLRLLFTEDARWLAGVLQSDMADSNDFIDPRGRQLMRGDVPVHVFIDHSNILIGFLNHLKRYPLHSSRRTRIHLYHTALTLILERGRPISRRVLAASSPLYQPMDVMEQLGYEVRVYARVPDLGDGADRLSKVEREREKEGLMKSYRRKGLGVNGVGAPGMGHSRKVSGNGSAGGTGSGATESDPGSSSKSLSGANGTDHGKGKGGYSHSRSSSLTVTVGGSGGSGNTSTSTPNANPTAANVPPSNTATVSTSRIRYREQGVDELLQLKLHQAIADIDVPPPGSTIVLATGDGNVGQFNEEGFRGCVRTALKKGWRVELVAWEVGLSKMWAKEFGGEEKFRMIGLEKFAQDLLEM